MTFEEFQRAVIRLAFPAGESKYAAHAHRASIQDALKDLQTWIPCLQRLNTEVVPHCATLYKCGTTAFHKPDGQILEVGVVSARSKKDTRSSTPFETGIVLKRHSYTMPEAAPLSYIPIHRIISLKYEFRIGIQLRISCLLKGAYPNTPGQIKVIGAIYHTASDGSQNTFYVRELNAKLKRTRFEVSVPINQSRTVNVDIETAFQSSVYMEIDSVQATHSYDGLTYSIDLDIFGPPHSRNPEFITMDTEWCGYIRYRYVEPNVFEHWMHEIGRGNGMAYCDQFGLPSWLVKKLSEIPKPISYQQDRGYGYFPSEAIADSHSGRALAGLWTIMHGMIHVLPWIQSYEAIVVRYSGMKRQWSDLDLVPDDPLLMQAVASAVGRDHAAFYDRNHELAAQLNSDYNDARRELYYSCISTNVPTDSSKRGDFSHWISSVFHVEEVPQTASPRDPQMPPVVGEEGGSGLFGNDELSMEVTCEDIGKSGTQRVRVHVPANQYADTSKALANQRAREAAMRHAIALLDKCSDRPECFTNKLRAVCTAQCASIENMPPAQGNPVTITIEPDTVCSEISEDDANKIARQLACAKAAEQLNCTYCSPAADAMVSCPTNPSIQVPVTLQPCLFQETIVGSCNTKPSCVNDVAGSLRSKVEAEVDRIAKEKLKQAGCEEQSKICRSIVIGENRVARGTMTCMAFCGIMGLRFEVSPCYVHVHYSLNYHLCIEFGAGKRFATYAEALAEMNRVYSQHEQAAIQMAKANADRVANTEMQKRCHGVRQGTCVSGRPVCADATSSVVIHESTNVVL